MRIYPHESHVMGTVGGERRCKDCWAAPDWAIIEEPCPSEGGDHRPEQDRDTPPPWLDDLIAEAYRAYDAGDRIEDIAARAGRTVDATTNRIAIYRAKHGLPPRPRRPQPKRVTRKPPTRTLGPGDMEVALERRRAGHLLTDIAEDLGVPYDSLRQKLRKDLRKQA